MQRVTILSVLLALIALPALGQESEFLLNVPMEPDNYFAPYSIGENGGGVQSGARGVNGPFDLDGDGLIEVLVTDYSGGGRVHVVENRGVDAWEFVYSTPPLDSTASVANARYATGADLDNDGAGEILFITGHSFSDANDLPLGMYVFEFTGTDDDYGDEPASILEFEAESGPPPSAVSEQFTVRDVDDDGDQEILVPGNSSNDFDIFYVYSVTGEIGSDFEVYTPELRLNPRSDGTTFGGGSPYAILPADLDGDGSLELSIHSWNNFNFFNVDITGGDEYALPEAGASNTHLAAFDSDHVSLFGGVVVDIDGNGDDEVYYPRFQSFGTGAVSVLNYEAGEDILQITTDNFILDVVTGVTSLGIAAGDLDSDGNIGLLGAGPSYSAGSFNNGNDPNFVNVAEFSGNDAEDPANYFVTPLGFFEPFDVDETKFDFIRRDSSGTVTENIVDTSNESRSAAGGHPSQGPLFASKLAFLGDADGDGYNELAIAFQGVDDSTYVIQDTFNPEDSTYTSEIVEARPNENRVFLRIVSMAGNPVAVDEPQGDLPQGFRLSANYPNPFNPTTSFHFTLPQDQRVSVKVYDAMGRLVKTLIDGQYFTQGRHQATWDGRTSAGATAASGTYFYTLEFDGQRVARPMVLVK